MNPTAMLLWVDLYGNWSMQLPKPTQVDIWSTCVLSSSIFVSEDSAMPTSRVEPNRTAMDFALLASLSAEFKISIHRSSSVNLLSTVVQAYLGTPTTFDPEYQTHTSQNDTALPTVNLSSTTPTLCHIL